MQAPAGQDIDALYRQHLAQLSARYDEALAATGFDAVLLGAGTELPRIFDDQHYPYCPTPTFLQWLPLRQCRDSALLYRPGERPVLLLYRPEDIWQSWPDIPAGPWLELIDIRLCAERKDIAAELAQQSGQVACIGEPQQWGNEIPPERLNPQRLLQHLNYYRPGRTGWEIACIRAATALAVPGHRAAAQAFRDGEAEFGILLAFLKACGQTENELPYPAIVARNEHGAVLHYQHYDREPGAQHSLLIDAGCQHCGYASDITRTYAHDDPTFTALIEALDAVQQQLAARVGPGVSFADLHAEAHRAIGNVLMDAGIVRTADSDPVADGITPAFFPHGLGHYLGLQVHEIGGHLADTSGAELERDARFPNLRLLRTLESGQVLTIEPGIYFIDSLLDTLRAGPNADALDWTLIDHLRRFGGIRIEDNVLVTDDGQENLTRDGVCRARLNARSAGDYLFEATGLTQLDPDAVQARQVQVAHAPVVEPVTLRAVKRFLADPANLFGQRIGLQRQQVEPFAVLVQEFGRFGARAGRLHEYDPGLAQIETGDIRAALLQVIAGRDLDVQDALPDRDRFLEISDNEVDVVYTMNHAALSELFSLTG